MSENIQNTDLPTDCTSEIHCSESNVCCCILFENKDWDGYLTYAYQLCNGIFINGQLNLNESHTACVLESKYSVDPSMSVTFNGCCDNENICSE